MAQSLAISLTSYALDRGIQFPYVTLPDFEIRVAKARELSHSDAISWSPLVYETQVEMWEKYASDEGPVWLRESLDESGLEDADIPDFNPRVHNSTGELVEESVFDDDHMLQGMYSVSWYVSLASLH